MPLEKGFDTSSTCRLGQVRLNHWSDKRRRSGITGSIVGTVLLLCLQSSSDLQAQKQGPAPKVQKPRRPVAPATAPKPRIRPPEFRPPATTPQVPFASLQPPVTEARLNNGLKVLLQEKRGTSLVSVGCWYRVGSRDDPAGAAGLSNLARLLRLREMDGPSRDKIGQLTRETGGDWHSMTLPDQTGFFETVPAGALEEVLKFEAARLSASAAIDDLQFRGQWRRASAALQAREDRPRSLLEDEVAASALRRHPYRWPSIGWLADGASIGRDDVARHSRQHFVPNNAILVLVGDFETRRALGLAEKYFGVVARRPDPRRIEVQEPERRGERRVRIGNEGTTPYLQLAFQAPELFNDDFYAMLVLDAVLTGAQGMRHWSGVRPSVAKISSRLFHALVETGLAVEVRSRMVPRQAPCLYQLTLTLPDAFQFQAAEEALLEQLERLKSQEVSDVELTKAKNLLVAGEFLAQDSVGKRAFQLGFFESVASHQVLSEFETKIATVKRDDLRRVATGYLSENVRTVGSFLPSAKRKAIEVETLSPSGSDSTVRTPSVSQPALAPRELNLRTPSLQPVFTPGSVFDSPRSDQGSQQKGPESQARLLAEIPTERLPAPRPQRKVLPNGSTLIAAATVSGSTVTIRAGIKTGAGGEFDVATVVGAMLLRGTSAKNQAPLATVFDYLGAEVSSEITDGIATISVRGLSKDCALFLQLLAEMLKSPSFVPSEFDKVREGLLGKLHELEGETDWAAEQALRQRFYPVAHPSRKGILGTVEFLRLADARDFYQRHYRPQHLIVSIAGEIAPEEALAAAENAFGTWKGETVAASSSATHMMASQKAEKVFELNTKRSALVLAGLASLSRDQPDYYPFLILNQILVGAPGGGRLGDRVLTADGAIYGVQGLATEGPRERLFGVRAMADPSEVEKVIVLMREEIGRINKLGFTDEEIRRAKRSLIHAWGVRMGNNEEVARMLQHIEAQGLGSDYLEKYPALIEGVSRDSLLDCAKTRFDFAQAAVVVARPGIAN